MAYRALKASMDFRNRLITVGAACAKNGEAHSVPMNEVLTEMLRAIRISEPMRARGMLWW
jgi:hypothetical protein